ncbi:MAG: gfo/Idh/MocA family oxidoreductase [Planctomycetota bacterium]|nr:MAG: gfo/Idh/MocA family oxidoreductase [Planctomycetota bacterium]
MTATATLKAGVVGLGVGEAHARAYHAHPHCRLAAVCDLKPERMTSVAARIPTVRCCSSADEILCDPSIDIVSIASYDTDHYRQVMQAIEHDKHVFVEKPLCMARSEALDIRRALSRKPHLKLSSNLILRKSPRFVALKHRIDRGELGELFLVEGDYHYGRLHKITHGWRGTIEFYSVVFGGAIHLVDLLLWLTGERVVEVSAIGNRVAAAGSQFKYNDTVLATLRFENDLIGKVGVSYGCMRPHFHGLSIYGTRATFINDTPHALLYESRDPDVPPQQIVDPYPGVQKGELLTDFVDAVVAEREPEVSAEDVFRSMAVCLAIEKAAAAGEIVRVEDI